MRVSKYLMIVALICLAACELPDNVDPKNPADVPPEALFTQAQVNFADIMSGSTSGTLRSFVQYWTPKMRLADYFDFTEKGISSVFWKELYKSVLINCKEARDLLNKRPLTVPPAQRANQLIIIEILEIYTYQALVDAFGNVPYSEALMATKGDVTPIYDDAETIYTDLLRRIDEAIVSLNDNYNSWGEADLIFGGDVTMWKKFGASLQLRIGMRLADRDPVTAQVSVQTAIQHGVFDDPSEGVILKFPGIQPHVNPLYNIFIVPSPKWIPANTIIDMMNATTDPRIDNWFTPLPDGSYRGAIYGLDAHQSPANFSHMAPPMLKPDAEVLFIDYVEVEFLLAEAVERGFDVPNTAEAHYNNAITASILYWGGSQDEVEVFLDHPRVAYTTASGDWRQKIGTQKWIALYNRCIESWSEWRRLDFPCLNVPVGLTYSDIPRRYPYPDDEPELNGLNYHAAVAEMGIVDDHKQPVFWDVGTSEGCE